MKNTFNKIAKKIKRKIKNIFNTNITYLHLKSIKRKKNKLYCEFSEILCVHGKLIRIDIEEIAKNKNIQKSIPTETLFIIGVIYGKLKQELDQYKLKLIDTNTKKLILENHRETISIKMYDFLHDKELLSQVSQLDLLKIFNIYFYDAGYKAHILLEDMEANLKEICVNSANKSCKNIINLR